MSPADIALGNQRLLQLAEMLDTADERHRANDEPEYDQSYFHHPCGTPSCAAGHWAYSNKDRWSFPACRLIDGTGLGIQGDLECEFCLSSEEYDELFECDGCACARTANDAAAYIRAFVARRQS